MFHQYTDTVLYRLYLPSTEHHIQLRLIFPYRLFVLRMNLNGRAHPLSDHIPAIKRKFPSFILYFLPERSPCYGVVTLTRLPLPYSIEQGCASALSMAQSSYPQLL